MVTSDLVLGLAVGLALAGGSVAGDSPPEADALDRSIAILDRLDQIKTSVNYLDTPLEEVVEDLNWFIDVPIAADWMALDVLGVDPLDEVTLRLEDVPLSTVLAAITLRLGDAFERPCFEVQTGQLLLTTLEATTAMRFTDVYDVRDLLAAEGVIDELHETLPPIPVGEPASLGGDDTPDTPAPSGADDASGAAETSATATPGTPERSDPSERPILTPGEQMMTLIAQHVDPEAWLEYGGTRATIGERNGVLLVTAAPRTHRKMRAALERLRRVYAATVTIEAALVDVPRAVYDRFARRYPPSSAALARALLTSPDATVQWQAVSGATLDEQLSFSSGKGPDGFELNLTPSLAAETGVLTIGVDARSEIGDDQRRVTTRVTVPTRNGGAVIELPAATAGDRSMFLVLVPQRR